MKEKIEEIKKALAEIAKQELNQYSLESRSSRKKHHQKERLLARIEAVVIRILTQ